MNIIGYNATLELWQDIHGKTVTPKSGDTIDLDINDAGFEQSLNELNLVARPLTAGLLKIYPKG